MFFGKRYQCGFCLDLFNFKNSHSCSEKCRYCEGTPPCKRSNEKFKCNDCNRYFYGQLCYDNHRPSVCKILKFCNLCGRLIDMRKRNYQEHSCEEKICSICQKIVPNTHYCYVQKYKRISPARYSIIFYDLECTQNTKCAGDTYLHIPNLCIAQIVCNVCCMEPQFDYCCPSCTNRQHVFENDENQNCVEKFISFCEIFRKKSLSIFCIAHNFKSYDGQFILQELVKRGKTLKVIMGGMKIFKIIYDEYITFIDSLNFLPMPLSKFPETFGLENLTKGWYPHFFNTTENYNYIGKIPGKEYFGISHMTEKEISRFNIWYNDLISSGLPYDNRKELIKYCSQDVDILRKGCVVFMTNFTKITTVNPLLQAFTLAQAVMHTFRKKCIQ